MAEERLHKVMAAAGFGSRRTCEQMIIDGLVQIGGRTVTEVGIKVDPAQVEITVDGKPLRVPDRHIYIKMNKPRNVVSDIGGDTGDHKSVADLLPDDMRRVFAVGRLDLNSEGLVLLTDDGELSHRLTHPSFEHPKTYFALIDEVPPAAVLEQLRTGVEIPEGKSAPARVRVVDGLPQEVQLMRGPNEGVWLEIILYEGKKRQIRHMLSAVNFPVRRLVRWAIGPLTLGKVRAGEWTLMKASEVNALRKFVELPPTSVVEAAEADENERAPRRAGGAGAGAMASRNRRSDDRSSGGRPSSGRPSSGRPSSGRSSSGRPSSDRSSSSRSAYGRPGGDTRAGGYQQRSDDATGSEGRSNSRGGVPRSDRPDGGERAGRPAPQRRDGGAGSSSYRPRRAEGDERSASGGSEPQRRSYASRGDASGGASESRGEPRRSGAGGGTGGGRRYGDEGRGTDRRSSSSSDRPRSSGGSGGGYSSDRPRSSGGSGGYSSDRPRSSGGSGGGYSSDRPRSSGAPRSGGSGYSSDRPRSSGGSGGGYSSDRPRSSGAPRSGGSGYSSDRPRPSGAPRTGGGSTARGSGQSRSSSSRPPRTGGSDSKGSSRSRRESSSDE